MTEPSPAAVSLLVQVNAAVDSSATSYELAPRLLYLLDVARALDQSEFDAVAAVIGVAQHSAEYWEVNLDAAVSEAQAEWGSCVQFYYDIGYSSQDAQIACISADVIRDAPTDLRRPQHRLWYHLAVQTPDTACERILDGGSSMGSKAKSVLRSDVEAAGAGAFGGIGTPAGPGGGAAASSGAISIGRMLGHAFDIWWCLVKKGGASDKKTQEIQ